MGTIENYYKQELTEVTNRGLESISKKFDEENRTGIKNSQLHDLAQLFLNKAKQAEAFSSIIQNADTNIEKLTKIDEQTNQKAMRNSLQQALFDEITYFQTTAKPTSLDRLANLNDKIKQYEKKVKELKEKIKSEKPQKKSASDRIKNFFGLGKTEEEKKDLQTIKDCEEVIRSTRRKLEDSKYTLVQAKDTSKVLKNSQQSNLGLMTEKSVKNAIHNSNKGTGMIGCLIQVADFLNKYYVPEDDRDIILDKNKSSLKSKLKGIFSRTSSKEKKNKNEQIKINSSELKKMKKLLKDDHPKHFMECQRKITKFSQVNIDSLKNSNNNTNFDVNEFNKLKENLKIQMEGMFSDLNKLIKRYAATVNDKQYDNNPKLRKKLQKAFAEDILYNEQDKLIKKYKDIRKEFMKGIKGLLPKSMKRRDDLAKSLASLAIFNCSTQLNGEDEAIQGFLAQKDVNSIDLTLERAGYIFTTAYCSICVFFFIVLFVTEPIQMGLVILAIIVAIMGSLASPVAIYGDKFGELEILSADITEQRLSAQ